MKKYNVGVVVGASALAVVAAVLSPLMIFGVSRLFLQTVVIAVLFAWAGPVPAGIFSIGIAGMCALLGDGYGTYGPMVTGAAAFALIVPAWISLLLLKKRLPFYQGLKYSIVAQCAATAIGIAALWYVSKTNLANMLMQMLKNFYEGQDPEIRKFSLALLQQAGLNITEENLSEFFEILRLGFLETLPPVLICSSITTGILSYALPSLICSRRGDEPAVNRVPLSEWRLPKNMILGLPACTIICFILYQFSVSGADTACNTLFNISLVAFAIQGIAAIDRRMKKVGTTRGRRTTFIVLLLVFCFGQMLPLAGLYSAFFGSEGLLSKRLRDKMKDMNDKNNRKDDE